MYIMILHLWTSLDGCFQAALFNKVLLEGALRNHDGNSVTEEHIKRIASWDGKGSDKEIPFMPSRIVLQDFTGVPVVVDLAAMRTKMNEMGGDPGKINPLVPVDLVIDHSVIIDSFGSRRFFQIQC
jgi:aconitate hydratase